MESVRIVFTHSSSSARWSVCTVKAAPLIAIRGDASYRFSGEQRDPGAPGVRSVATAFPGLTRRVVSDISICIAEYNNEGELSMTRDHAMHNPCVELRLDPRAIWAAAMGGGGQPGPGGHRGGPHRGRGRRGGRGWGPGDFGPGFPFGPGRGPRARRGDVRAALLTLLAEEPRNGYQLMQEIERRSEGVWRPSPGSVYPALQLLEDEGLVRAEEHDGRRLFVLTDAGRAHVDEQGDALREPWKAAAEEAGDEMLELRKLVGQVAAAVMQVVVAGSEGQQAEARKVLADTRRALYKILAEDDPEDDGEGERGEA